MLADARSAPPLGAEDASSGCEDWRLSGEREDWEKIIIRALGLTPRGSSRLRRWSYRNHFATTWPDPVLEGMVERGLMIFDDSQNGKMRFYRVTDAGAEFAGVRDRLRNEDRV